MDDGKKVHTPTQRNAEISDTILRTEICDAETVQALLDLLNPLHGSLDEQTYDRKHRGEFEYYDMPDDYDLDVNVTARMERDLHQAVCILEDRKRQFAALSKATNHD